MPSRSSSFSPLFIGASRSTSIFQRLPLADRPFQSPLHWGIAFNLVRVLAVQVAPKFQSPLHWGIAFNSLRPHRTRQLAPFSFPSLFGHPVRLTPHSFLEQACSEFYSSHHG